jgi:hypothetical protein
MACKLSGEGLYKAPPDRDVFSQEDALAFHPRCMEQTCFSVGSCLLSPCDSLRPKPALPSSFDLVARNEHEVTGEAQELLCSYLSLEDYKLYYKAFDQSQGDCWKALEGTKKALSPSTQDELRVWEQIGFVPQGKAKGVLEDYNRSYTNIIEDSAA